MLAQARTRPARVPAGAILGELAAWPLRRWLVVVGAAVAAALFMAVPTDILPNPMFRRMIPVVWWDYPVLAGSSILLGLLAATYVRIGRREPSRDRAGSVLGLGFVSYLAVGCPICNKLVVVALGASGALTYFGPVQPFLGLTAVGLLSVVLLVRLRGLVACPARTS